MGKLRKIATGLGIAGLTAGVLLATGGAASATNTCAMRGLMEGGTSVQVWANEPALTCDGGSIQYKYKTSSTSSTYTTTLDWGYMAQGTWQGSVVRYTLVQAAGKSYQGSGSGATYSSAWTVKDIYYTWG